MTSQKQSEAEKEMELIFGTDEEMRMTPIDNFKMFLTKRQYNKSSIMFRLIFDKKYRPDRFNAIVNKQEKFRNKNEFRTYVMNNYYKSPLASSAFFSWSK